jgi:XTP/dITP diphosphohydrolase
MEIYLVTRNQGKLMAAQEAFKDSSVQLMTVEKDYPEIQANTSSEVAEYTSILVAKELGKPAIREDHSIFLNALNGVPGPYMSYFNSKLSEDDVLNLYQNLSDRSGYFEVATSIAYPDGEHFTTSFQVPFTLATEAKGDLQNGWNKIIILEGENRTLAEYPETERTHIWQKGYLEVKAKILEKLSL